MKRLLGAFATNASGTIALEYVFVATLVSVLIVAGATQIGTLLAGKFAAMTTNLN